MEKIKLCKNCKYFNITSKTVVDISSLNKLLYFQTGIEPAKIGNCLCPIEPKYSRLKNEYNGCKNFSKKI